MALMPSLAVAKSSVSGAGLPSKAAPKSSSAWLGRRAVVDDVDVGGVLTAGSGMDQVEAGPGDVLDVDPAEHLVGFDDATGSPVPKAVED